MARVQTVRIEGLAQLDRALRELPERIANRGLRASVYAGAKVIRDEARVVALSLCDASGTRLFEDNEIAALGLKSARALDRVFSVAQRLNGIGTEQAASVKKV